LVDTRLKCCRHSIVTHLTFPYISKKNKNSNVTVMAKSNNNPNPSKKRPRPDNWQKLLEDYFEAFEKSRNESQLTQKMLAEPVNQREGDFSDVFGFMRKTTDKAPTPPQKVKVFHAIDDHWKIDKNGFLVKKVSSGPKSVKQAKKTAFEPATQDGPVIAHKSFPGAEVSVAVSEDGSTIRIINTYLSTAMFNAELTKESENSIRKWLHQGKKIQLLLLIPDGKGMRLRTKTDLGFDGDGITLADTIMMRLKRLLSIQTQSPEQMQVRLMDELPGMSAIILEKKLFFGLYYSFGHSENASYFEINDPKHQSYQDIAQHFKILWDDNERSSPLTQELIDKADNALTVLRSVDIIHNSRWRLFMHDLGTMVHNISKAPFESPVGVIAEWDLEIRKPEKDIYLQAILTIPGMENPMKASVVTERIHNQDYAHIRFSDFKNISIHITFHCREDKENSLIGYVQINSGTDSCSAYIIMKKYEAGEENNITLNEYYGRLLTFRDGSYNSLERVRNDKAKLDIRLWAGTYKIYSYGSESGSSKYIKVNWLRIDERGVATYKNQYFGKTNGRKLEGRATHISPNVHIVFTFFPQVENQRRSYLIMTVGNRKPEPGRFYSGVHLGVTWDDEVPVGKRFILEYCPRHTDTPFENLIVEKITMHSQRYKSMNAELRKMLSGRIKNMLGFLRKAGRIFEYSQIVKEWEASIDLSEVFYDSAVQHAKRSNYAKSAQVLLRAVNHGFDDLARFEKEVEKDYPGALDQIVREDDYQKAVKILSSTGESFDPRI